MNLFNNKGRVRRKKLMSMIETDQIQNVKFLYQPDESDEENERRSNIIRSNKEESESIRSYSFIRRRRNYSEQKGGDVVDVVEDVSYHQEEIQIT